MKTAVEWLIEELKGVYESDYLNKLVQQAKEMEKEQIIDAYESLEHRHGENYYNETYKSKQ
jgi:hypothetical protein